jgi:hypothetical protein
LGSRRGLADFPVSRRFAAGRSRFGRSGGSPVAIAPRNASFNAERPHPPGGRTASAGVRSLVGPAAGYSKHDLPNGFRCKRVYQARAAATSCGIRLALVRALRCTGSRSRPRPRRRLGGCRGTWPSEFDRSCWRWQPIVCEDCKRQEAHRARRLPIAYWRLASVARHRCRYQGNFGAGHQAARGCV